MVNRIDAALAVVVQVSIIKLRRRSSLQYLLSVQLRQLVCIVLLVVVARTCPVPVHIRLAK